jgi:hypothetical protein
VESGVPIVRSERDRIALAITSLPGLVGLGLGTIYALGAIQVLRQYNHAGLDEADLFPLIPLNQVLARGISLAINYSVIAVLLGLLASMITYLRPTLIKATVRKHKPIETALTNVGAPLWAVGPAITLLMLVNVGVLVIFLLFAPWFIFPTLAAVYAYFVFAGRWLSRWVSKVRATALLAIGLLLITGALGTVLYPTPLPEVILELEDGTTIESELAVSTEDSWYLKNGPAVRVIPKATVVRAEIEKVSQHLVDRRSLTQLLGSLF